MNKFMRERGGTGLVKAHTSRSQPLQSGMSHLFTSRKPGNNQQANERVHFPLRITPHLCHHTHTTFFALTSHLHTRRQHLSSLSLPRIQFPLAASPHSVFKSSKQRRPASRPLNLRRLRNRNSEKKRNLTPCRILPQGPLSTLKHIPPNRIPQLHLFVMQLRHISKSIQALRIISSESRLRHTVAIFDLYLRWDLSVVTCLFPLEVLIQLNRRRQWGVRLYLDDERLGGGIAF